MRRDGLGWADVQGDDGGRGRVALFRRAAGGVFRLLGMLGLGGRAGFGLMRIKLQKRRPAG